MAFVYVDYPPSLRSLMEQILDEDFMRKHTRFESFEAFQYSSAVFVQWNAEQLVYNEEVFDNFVKESTEFPSWDAMVRAATDCHFSPSVSQ